MPELSVEAIAGRRRDALEAIAGACERARRNPAEVRLLAVTKTHGPDVVRAAASAGQALFGENRVVEGVGKIEATRAEYPDLEWRLIGPLQSNKAGLALQWFSALETLDRQRLVDRLERLLEGGARRLPVLIEVNLGEEATKSGVPPSEVPAFVATALAAPHLDVRGLMAVPPFDADPERSRPHFRRLRRLARDLEERFGRAFPELSMGMSHDFAVAVEEGATEVRLGTALFGARETA